MNSDTLATCREALERWYEDLEAHDAIYHVDNPAEIMKQIDRALQDLEQPVLPWAPLQTKIAFGFGHESIVIDATSIGGLPLPDDVMIMQRTPAQPRSTFNLIPCAHCGGEAKIIRASKEYEGLVFLIKCCRCPATMDFDSVLPELEAIAAWNQRAPQPAAGMPLPEDAREAITEWRDEYDRKALAWTDLNANNELAVKYARQVDAIDAWLQHQRGAGVPLPDNVYEWMERVVLAAHDEILAYIRRYDYEESSTQIESAKTALAWLQRQRGAGVGG